jgi:3-phosphoshikimate 1-carboxyvinyltransferase
VSFESNNGLLPAVVKGPIVPGNIEIDGSLSSQFLSGILVALPRAGGVSVLDVVKLKSKPYVRMTLEVMEKFGLKVAA